MASILDFLKTDKGQQFVNSAGAQLGENPEKIQSALAMAMPMMLGALKKNAGSQHGADSLNKALDDPRHDGSILDKLTNQFQGGGVGNLVNEGAGILGHIFGGKQNQIEEAVGTTTGMQPSKVSSLLKMAAPVVLGILGSQKRKDNVDHAGLSSLLGSVMGSDSDHDQSLLETFLDSDGKDKILSKAAGKILGNKGNSKGLGDFFKG